MADHATIDPSASPDSASPDNDGRVAEYLSAAARDPDPNVFLQALAGIARAHGMAQLAKDAGLGRESLYKALASGAHPRFETVRAVLRALNLRLVLVPNGGSKA